MFGCLGKLFSKADAYDPSPFEEESLECQYEVFKRVWPEAAELRASGKLLEERKRIQCPVVVIHVTYDTHVVDGVDRPLSGVINDFQCIVMDKCGHQPWLEKQAKEQLAKLCLTAFVRFHRFLEGDANTLLSIVCEFASAAKNQQNHYKIG